MKASKFSDAQKAFILKQGDDGVPVAEICRKAGISQATYFNWRKKYAGLLPDEMRRLKGGADENLDHQGGSSCIPTQTDFERSSCISGWASDLTRPFGSWVILQRMP